MRAGLLHDLELSLPMSGERIFPIVPDPHKLIDILLMDLIDIGWVGILRLLDADRLADDNVHRTSVRHKSNIVVKDTCRYG